MGRSITPKYRIETRGNINISAGAWSGRATSARLEDHVRALNKSFQVGGANAHLGSDLGFIPYLWSAEIVRQSDDKVVAAWVAAKFEVFE